MQIKKLVPFYQNVFQFCTGPLKTVNPTKFAGKLTILPTPIGNLQDLSPNIIKALFKADIIGCEDRRVAGKLYTLIKSKNIMESMTSDFGEVGLNSLIPLLNQNDQPKSPQQENYLYYEYANMTQKQRKKFIRKMTKEQQQKFKIDFLKYRALKILSKEDDFMKKEKEDRYDQLYGIDSSDLEHIELQIRNTRMKKGRGVLIPLNTYSQTKMFSMVKMFLETKNVAIISDAGMPCISDPGWKMVRKIRQTHPEVPIEVIGGPSTVSLITSLASLALQPNKNSLSGRFEGFAPQIMSQMTQKSVEIEEAKKKQFSIHFINSKKLRNKVIELEKNYGSDQKILLANELTKLYERKYHGTLGQLNDLMSKEDNEFQGIGQLSYLVYPPENKDFDLSAQNDQSLETQTIDSPKIQKITLARLNLISIENFIDSIKIAEEEIQKAKTQSPIGQLNSNQSKIQQNQTGKQNTEKKVTKIKSQSDASSKDLVDLICTVFGIKTSEARKLVYQKQIAIKNKKLGRKSQFISASQAYEKQQKEQKLSQNPEKSEGSAKRVGRRTGRKRETSMSSQQEQFMKMFKDKNLDFL